MITPFNFQQGINVIWFEKAPRKHRKVIKAQIVDRANTRYITPLQNLIVREDSLILKTGYNYDYKQGDEFYLIDGYWRLLSVGADYKTESTAIYVNPQYASRVTYLELIKVDD